MQCSTTPPIQFIQDMNSAITFNYIVIINLKTEILHLNAIVHHSKDKNLHHLAAYTPSIH